MNEKRKLIIAAVVLLQVYLLSGCGSDTRVDNSAISVDSVTIASGEAVFNQHCSGCHNFRGDGIGPLLSGLTTKASAEWIQNFIKDPQHVISSGDERAGQLINRYKVVMPSFPALKDDEVSAIIAFMHTHKSVDQRTAKKDGELLDPVPDTLALSNLAINLELVTQIPASSDSGRMPRTRITKLDFQPQTGDLFINDLRGKLYTYSSKLGFSTVYLDIAKLVDVLKPKSKFIHEPGLATGFGSFAFHPGFDKNGLLYTTHTEPPGSGKADFGYADSIKTTLQWVLTEWQFENPRFPAEIQMREILRVNMVSGIHGVQEITFNPNAKPGQKDYGMLYIGVGDGGSVENGYDFLVHSIEKVWGTILRIDPKGRNSANRQYGIPKDNPFEKSPNSKSVKEIYAYGFRNPHRITWTSSGKMLASNIGQGNIEALDLIIPGADYGWPIREGTFVSSDLKGNLGKVFPLPANDSIYKITYPVAQYDHDEGIAISGGYEYQGTAIPELKGKYLFGDIPTGKLFYVEISDLKHGRQAPIKEWKVQLNNSFRTLKEICGSERVDLHFGRDAHGEMYILTKADGQVYKLSSAATNPSD